MENKLVQGLLGKLLMVLFANLNDLSGDKLLSLDDQAGLRVNKMQ